MPAHEPIDLLAQPNRARAAASPGREPRRLEIPERVRGMLGPIQIARVARELAGGEDPAAIRKTSVMLLRQDAQLSRMPAKFGDPTAERLALARYCEQGRGWYVLAYDAESSMAQCLIVARDVAELGYISLKMLIAMNVHMDLQYGAEPVRAVFQRHGIELPSSLALARLQAEPVEPIRPHKRRRMQ